MGLTWPRIVEYWEKTMINEDKLRELLHQAEDRSIDFKAEPHRLDNDHFKSLFVKDILAMANTPREEAAYIITGIRLHDDGPREYLGVDKHPDDSDLQDKLKIARVDPVPAFVYQPVTFEGKSYGVFEIPVQKSGPYFATRDYETLKAHRLYFRRGTQNDEATIHEQDEIYRWFHEEQPRAADDKTTVRPPTPNWDRFALACHQFDSERLYLLLIGPEKTNEAAWQFLARLPVSLVLDFDPETEQNGIYSVVNAPLRNHCSVHLLTIQDAYNLVPQRACYWYASRGLNGRSKSLVSGDWREWNRKYSGAIRGLLDDFARSSTGKPLTVISLWYAPEYVREVCSAVDRAFGDLADYVFATSEADRLQNLAEQFNGEAILISPEDVLFGIAEHVQPVSEEPAHAAIPAIDGTFRLLDAPILQWLSEDLEVLHSNIEMEAPDEQRQIGRDFLRGETINWSDLSGHYDADRDITEQVRDQVEKELGSRTTVRMNLYHWPGAGGTTLARRVAWDLRRRYPTVLLRRITIGETVGRLRELFKVTAQPILAVIEGADTVTDRLENLYTEVRTEQIPAVLLSVLRRHELPQARERAMFLGSGLSLAESHRFLEAYKRVAPDKVALFQDILNRSAYKDRTPFHFALSAFGKDYIGLTRYVEARVQTATPIQKEIITFLALAYYYGHKAVLPQVFAPHLGRPENRLLHLETVLGEIQLELLIKETTSKWRPAHQIIAEEILEVVLSGDSTDRRNWKTGISTWGLEFIKICAKCLSHK